ncbi:MAG: translation initiation factor IF-3 [Verrucomicrobiae bacterium]|nr:translation initiation factor IF-3 [Verrucomicrobiae bacterium]
MNGKIRAREVRVIGDNGQQLGVIPLSEALTQARARGVDLVEVAPNATPPVCRMVDFGKYKYEQEKRQKENRKHQHASKVKEIQLSATIDPHDFQTKLDHAIEFLCEDMKVKASLRFRGREMAHTEFGFKTIRRFIAEVAPWGHPDFEPKLTGRSVNVMVSPLPRNRRAPHPKGSSPATAETQSEDAGKSADNPAPPNPAPARSDAVPVRRGAASQDAAPEPTFSNNPFDGLQMGSADNPK